MKHQPTQAEIEDLVRKAVAETGAAGKQDTGQVMDLVMPQIQGRADGKLVSQAVSAALAAGETKPSGGPRSARPGEESPRSRDVVRGPLAVRGP